VVLTTYVLQQVGVGVSELFFWFFFGFGFFGGCVLGCARGEGGGERRHNSVHAGRLAVGAFGGFCVVFVGWGWGGGDNLLAAAAAAAVADAAASWLLGAEEGVW
jgi:hypothetical protein